MYCVARWCAHLLLWTTTSVQFMAGFAALLTRKHATRHLKILNHALHDRLCSTARQTTWRQRSIRHPFLCKNNDTAECATLNYLGCINTMSALLFDRHNCLLLLATACYCLILLALLAIARHCFPLLAIACYCLSLLAIACYCCLLLAAACYCSLLLAIAC